VDAEPVAFFDLTEALPGNRMIGNTVGLLMAAAGVDRNEAYRRLVRRSQDRNPQAAGDRRGDGRRGRVPAGLLG
jgi:hypothetical protein